MNLPPDFLDQLRTARRFTGPYAQAAPWQRQVILHGGKLYASDNSRIIEIECGVAGTAIFTARIRSLLESFGDAPVTIEIGDDVRFGWGDGRYLKVRNDYDHDDVVARMTDLLDRWHGTPVVEDTALEVAGRGIEIKDGPALVDGTLAPRHGFFYHRDGTPTSRLVRGDSDLRLDDLFEIRKKELDAARKASERKRDRLLDEQARIERELALTEQEIAADMQRIADFDTTLTKYSRGVELDEIDRERLQPSCESAIRKEENAERKSAVEDMPKPPKTIKGWEQCGDRNDGEYVYVTYRRRLPTTTVRKVIRKRIEQAVGRVFNTDFPRDVLVPVWKSLAQIEPRAGPG
ncbi:hypothetical protein RYZ20_09985 [Thioclava sp. A2]|uniref:hypothetical protein n=1 Tax=Thioclava sp. FCG-A2 TaxID=3080562 RepID=UPI0029534676|nr:hypothetical protein [Thioclava sp. A2]MDV7271230.1 hypothetical protein [Thioclava sp. A2]